MPRNGSGVYSLPAGNPVVPGTTIDTSWANSTMEDLGNELTNSLSRTGAGGMLGPLRLTDGTITAPSLAFTSETNTGLYRSGAASVWMGVLGANIAQFSSTGVVIASGKALTVQGNATVGGTFGVTGAATLSSTLSVTGAITATGGVLGNVTAASGTSTFNNVTINGDLDMNAGSSGTITNLPNPTNSGDAANKAYVDAQDALRLALTGGTMTGAIAMSNQKITGVGTPSADGDAANKAYVDSVAQGLDIKASVRAATTANISLSGTQTIDGVSIGVGDRVLVKDQSTSSQNGIYVAASSSWSRSSDADTWAELVGAFVFVEDGTTNDNSGWVCTVAPGGTLGSTAVTWEQFSGAGQVIAGTGMTKTGNTLNVNTASSARIVVGADDIDLATTGVTASTYKSVTVDAYGRVTAGTNPTTLAGFGIGDAYTQTQVDNLLAAKLSLSGGTMTGAIAMGTYKITGLGDPTLAQDAATKNYIDTIFGSTTSAAASAAAAASSASDASGYASAASTSASNASTSASNASGSASSALSYLNTFRGQYLGASASNPTVDGNGNALTAGDLYFNTTASEMRVYDGAAWAAAYLPASGYAALASTNTFTAPQIISVNSSSDALKITQVGSGNALYIEDSAADATPFVVSSTGVLGIGTTTPDNVTSAGIALVSNSGYYPQLVQRNTANDANASYIVLDKNRNGAIVQSGDSLGNILFRSFDGTNYLQSAAIIGYSDGTPGTNDAPGALSFLTTADGASSPTERLRITNTGAATTSADWTINGVRVGRGAGSVSTNTAVGASALNANTTGAGNTAVGYQAASTFTTSNSVTAVGYQAGASCTGDSWTAVGSQAMQNATTGTENQAFGNRALRAVTSGSYNTAIGKEALLSNTTGASNTAVGYQALLSKTTASYNTAIGQESQYSGTTGDFNASLGYQALYNNTGSNNTAIGARAMNGAANTGNENTAVGAIALQANTSGNLNVAIGYNALKVNTTGYYNTAVGANAAVSNTTGIALVAIGQSAMLVNTTGNRNIAIGSNDGAFTSPLRFNQTGSDNIAIGTGALGGNSNYSNNIAIGTTALGANTTGTPNVAVGYYALKANTTGNENVAVGAYALQSNTTGARNTAVGYGAAGNSVSGSYQTAFGFGAISSNTGDRNTAVGELCFGWGAGNGSYNCGLGYRAGFSNTSGHSNVAIGDSAFGGNTSGIRNTAVGTNALGGVTTGSYNTGIGHGAGSAGSYLTTGSSNIYIGDWATSSASNSSFEIVIGSGNGGSQVVGRGSNTGYINPGGGNMYQGTNGTSWSVYSDRRLKKNIVDNTEGLDKITQIRVRNFEYRLPEEVTELPSAAAIQKSGVQLGVISQELQEVCPDCVKEETTGALAVDTDNVFWHMVNAIKELNTRLQAAEAEIATLKGA